MTDDGCQRVEGYVRADVLDPVSQVTGVVREGIGPFLVHPQCICTLDEKLDGVF